MPISPKRGSRWVVRFSLSRAQSQARTRWISTLHSVWVKPTNRIFRTAGRLVTSSSPATRASRRSSATCVVWGAWIDRADTVPEALKLAESMARPSVTPSKTLVKEPKPAPKKPKPVPKPAPLSKDAEIVFSHLRDHPRTRPTTRKKLEHHITSLLGNRIDAAVTNAVINELTIVGALAFEGTKPRYVFPKTRKQDGAG